MRKTILLLVMSFYGLALSGRVPKIAVKGQDVEPQAAAGDLDTSFGNGGKVVTDFFGHFDQLGGIAIQSDGKIVAAGATRTTDQAVPSFFVLARYNVNGSLDTSFGTNGIVTTDFFGAAFPSAAFTVAIQRDGKIVAAGGAVPPTGNTEFALARYNPNGSLDAGFGANGKVTTAFPGTTANPFAIAIGADGKIVIAGQKLTPAFVVSFALARYNPDGSLDTSFGSNGTVSSTVAGASDQAFAVAVQPDNKVLIAGTTKLINAGASKFVVVRFNANGTLDLTFGSNGHVIPDFSSFDSFAFSIALQTDGKIVAAGRAQLGASTDSTDFALARYNPDGTPDASFNGGGLVAEQSSLESDYHALALTGPPSTVTTDFSGFLDGASALVVQADGKIVAAGVSLASTSTNFDSADLAIARYRSNGQLDPTFGVNGKVVTDFRRHSDSARSVALQTDGKIVAAGTVFAMSSGLGDGDFGLARYIGIGSDFELILDQSSIIAERGTKVPVNISINRTGGFSGNVTITPPDTSEIGVRVKPADPQSTTDPSVKVKLKVKASAVTGSHQLLFTGKDDSGRTRTAALILTLQ